MFLLFAVKETNSKHRMFALINLIGFRKFSTSIDFAAYSDWRSQHPVPPSPESTATELAAGQSATTSHSPNLHDGKDNLDVSANSPGSYPLTFNHIVDLITSGQPVPGIKEIPDTLLEGQSSETKKEQRKKPWEKERQDNHPSIEGAAPENEAG